MKFIYFFLIPIDQKYQNESSPIFCYAKSTRIISKNSFLEVPPTTWLKIFKLRKAHSGVVSESSGSPFHEVFRPPLSGKIPIPIMVYLPDGIKFAKMLRVFESGTAAKSPPSRKQCSLPSVQVV